MVLDVLVILHHVIYILVLQMNVINFMDIIFQLFKVQDVGILPQLQVHAQKNYVHMQLVCHKILIVKHF